MARLDDRPGWDRYSPEEHAVWKTLFERQTRLLPGRACDEFVCPSGSASPNRLRFDLERVMRTNYRIDDFQECYFVVDDLDELLEWARIDFAPLYSRLESGPEYEPGDVVERDVVLSLGSGEYHRGKQQAT